MKKSKNLPEKLKRRFVKIKRRFSKLISDENLLKRLIIFAVCRTFVFI